MDELALLKDFRLEDAATDGAREHARAALQETMNRRRLSRRYAIALAFVAAALLAAGAYAIVHEFVIGAPAPKDLNARLEFDVGHFFDFELIPWRGHPRKTSGPTVVAAADETPKGPVYLLLTPLQGGGQCLFMYTGRVDGPPPPSLCNLRKSVAPGRFVYFTHDFAPALEMIVGHAPGSVRVSYGGESFETPFGWFVVPSREDQVLTAYGAHGGVVARVRLGQGSRPTETPKPHRTRPNPVPVGTHRIIISTTVGWAQAAGPNLSRTWRRTDGQLQVAVSADSGGGRCLFARVDGDPYPLVGCGFPRSGRPAFRAFPVPLGWTEGRAWFSILVVLGQAGPNIARADVHFSDGRSTPATLRDGIVFYQVRRSEYRAGHRPIAVVARDSGGNVVARKRLPFVR